MDEYRFLATALVVGLIAPLFWLGVNVFDGWVQRNVYPGIRRWFSGLLCSVREKIGRRKSTAATKQLGDARRIGEDSIRR
jgi:hypothetical protein